MSWESTKLWLDNRGNLNLLQQFVLDVIGYTLRNCNTNKIYIKIVQLYEVEEKNDLN